MLCRRGNSSVFCGADADFLDSDGILAMKYKHDMEKLSEGIALSGTICEKRIHIIPGKRAWNRSMHILGHDFNFL